MPRIVMPLRWAADLYLGDKFKWNYGAGFALVAIGSFFIFHKW
jgi:uncharacterized protein (DUF486 family)